MVVGIFRKIRIFSEFWSKMCPFLGYHGAQENSFVGFHHPGATPDRLSNRFLHVLIHVETISGVAQSGGHIF